MHLGMSMDTFGFTRRSGENPGQTGLPSCRAMMDLSIENHRGPLPENDWMEFQAAYIGGALLMPYP